MKVYECVGRIANLACSITGDGDYNPTANLAPMEANKDAVVTMALLLDAIGSDWNVDILEVISKARMGAEE